MIDCSPGNVNMGIHVGKTYCTKLMAAEYDKSIWVLEAVTKFFLIYELCSTMTNLVIHQ